MKENFTISRMAFKNYLNLIPAVLRFLFIQSILGAKKNNIYPKLFRNGLKSFLVCMALALMPSVTKADTPIPTSVTSNYNAALLRLTMTVNWSWGSTASQKHVGAAVFADLNGDGITPTIFDNPATYTSGGNPFPAGLQARDEFLGQLAISNIEGSASSSLFAGSDNTDNGIASGVSGMTATSARLLFPYLGNSIAVVNSATGTFTLTYNNVPVSPTKICVVLYDPHTPFEASGNHSVTSAGSGRNTDNSIEDGNANGTVPCNSLVVLRCAINKTESPCQTQAAINASYAAWLASVTGTGCNGVLTNNSTGAPSAAGGSKTVTFTYTQSSCSNQAAVTTCTATFTVPSCTNSIGDRVWFDTDGDGIQDATETGGVPGVTVQLRNSVNTVIATQNTDATGNYLFTGLTAGTYTVVFPVSISGAVITTANVGANDDMDSDPSQTTGITPNIVLASGQNIVNVDAGYRPVNLQLGNRVWNDVNNNGINEATENGMHNIAVKLYKDDNNDNVADGAAIANTTTNATGYYLFSNLIAGNYIIGVTMPAGYMSSGINGGDPDNNTDADDNGEIYAGTNEIRGLGITLSGGTEPTNNGNENLTYDFGLFLYNVVYNCISIATTSGGTRVEFLGVTYSGTSPNITSKFTYKVTSGCSPNVSHFDFGNLTCISCFDDAGDFAAVTGSPYSIGKQKHTGLCGIKYDFSVACNTSTTVSFTLKGYLGVGTIQFGLKAGQNIEYADICGPVCAPPGTGSIGDRVWLDVNGNGLQDGTETAGIAGVTVQLRNSANTVIAIQNTNASGNYMFTGLAAGTYTLAFPVSISGAVITSQNAGSNDDIDSDPSQTTGITGNIVLATNQNITNADAGYRPANLQLGNRVWYDTNNNGINEVGENGIRNVTVKLYQDNNNDNVADGVSIANDITDADGDYLFTNLSPGNYIVGVVRPAGYVSSSINGGDPDNNIDNDDNGQVLIGNEVRGLAITLANSTEPTGGNTNNTYDFGLLPDCNCTNSLSNLLVNASFENGTTGWNWIAANGSLTTGTGYVACGTKNGFNNQSSGTSKVWQDVNVSAGATVVLTGFAGTHAPGITCSPKLSLIFLNSANVVIGQTDVNVTRVVGDYHNQLEQYTITAAAPLGTVKARVQSSITCNSMKLDAFCLRASLGGPLAINMAEFTATKNKCAANLTWQTSSEVNSDRFEVEVSANNNAVYTAAGMVVAAGNSSTASSYQFSYLMQPGSTYFFRLKMHDKDGSFKYSDIRSLNCTVVNGIVIAPNPVLTRFTITGMENGKNNVAVYDASGQLMKTQLIAQSQGDVNIMNLEPGFYTLKITSETGNRVIKKIIKH